MITPREDFGDEYIDELIAEYGDEPRLCVSYEEWYFGEPEEDPPYPNEWVTELFFVDEKEEAFDVETCILLVGAGIDRGSAG